MLPEGFQQWEGLLLTLLVLNILYIGLVTISQRDLDRMLGNSSVMHMGYAFLGIACVNAIGWSGAVMMMFAHGVSIALLFALCGQLRERTGGELEMTRFGGLASKVPMMALCFGFAAMASLGLPGFANFASELTIFLGAFKGFGDGALDGLQIATVLALWGVVISAVYMLRAYRNLFQGDAKSDISPADLTSAEKLPIFLMIAVLLLVGFFPNLLLNAVGPAVTALLGVAN
jgi:NADH-quinone oxidoreductase subunit M